MEKDTLNNKLKEIEISENIADGAFSNCYDLEKVIIKDGVTEIGVLAFDWCVNLKKIELPDTLTKIGEQAFRCCFELRNIEIPESVTEIGYSAFLTTGLQSIRLPKSIDHFNKNMFPNCNLVKIIYAPSVPVSDIERKFKLPAVFGFAEMVMNSEQIDDKIYTNYLAYIIKRRKALYKEFPKHESLLRLMLRENVIPKEDSGTIIEILTKNNRVDLTAEFLEYINQNRGK